MDRSQYALIPYVLSQKFQQPIMVYVVEVSSYIRFYYVVYLAFLYGGTKGARTIVGAAIGAITIAANYKYRFVNRF